MNYNSRKSNFYDSHAQREMTLACSEDTEQWWLYCRDERGGGTDILTRRLSALSPIFGVKVPFIARGGDVQQS